MQEPVETAKRPKFGESVVSAAKADPRRTRFVLLLAAALFTSHAAISSPQETFDENWRWVHFTTEDGLPSNHIIRIVESTGGTVWAATSKGIAWYDNFRWNSIDSTKGLPCEAPQNIERDINDGLLVVVGFRLYRGGKDGFHRIPIEGVQNAVPLSNEALWILARDTLFVYARETFSVHKPSLEIIGGRQKGLWSKSDHSLWLAAGGSLYRWDGTKWVCKVGTNLGYLSVAAFAENEQGTGVLCLRGIWELWEWRQGGGASRNIRQSAGPLRAMAVGPDGDALAACESGEVRIRRGDSWTTLTSRIADLHHITDLQFRRNGDLWVGTEEGLHFYRASSSRWKYIKYDSPDARDMVNEIIRARDGRIWLATSGGAEIIGPGDSRTTIGEISRMPIRSVTGLAEDNSGNIWISSGSAFSGAYRWNGTRWDYFRIAPDSNRIFVHKILRDRSGRLWFMGISPAQKQPGAYVLDGTRFIHWGSDEGLLSERVYAFAEDSTGAFWFGTFLGLQRWKSSQMIPGSTPGDGRWTNFGRASPSDRVFAITVDAHNRVWFSNQDQGLSYVGSNGEISHLTTSDGLISDRVWNVRSDRAANLWVSTTGGLSYYHDGIWSNFDYKNGLPNPSVWPLLLEEDSIFIGTIGSGLAILNLRDCRIPPPKTSIDKPVTEGTTAYCRWHVFSFWGEPASRDVLTRYRLDGHEWSAWEIKRELTIDNLSSGSHSIQVQAAGLLGDFHPDGEERSFSIALPFYRHPVFFLPTSGLGLTVLILGVSLLIRKRKHTIALRKSELKFRRLTEAAFEGIAIHEDGIILDANQSILNMFGYSYTEFVGRSALEFIVPEAREAVRLKMLDDSENLYEATGMKKDGSNIIVEIIGKTIPYENRAARVIAVRDITDRKRAEQRLLEYKSQLQSLASQLSLTEEQERRRMAEYLHEYIVQTLALCKIKLDSTPEPDSPDDQSRRLDEVNVLLDQMIKNTRSLTFELSPPALYELDFEDAIEWLTEQMQEQYGIGISFEDDENVKPLSDQMRILLFHAARELLVNVVKHARARGATVSLRRYASNFHLLVEDDGVGFSSDMNGNTVNGKRGFGLFHIRERLAYFGGRVEVDSHPGRGARITLIAPLHNPEETPAEKNL